MTTTGLKQLDMWTCVPSPTEPEKAGDATTTSPESMSWLAVFHVRISPQPGNVRVFEKAHALVSGGNSIGLLASYDPVSCCWKMSEGLPTRTKKKWGYFDKQMRCWLLGRCPKSAMTRHGKLYLLRMPERPIFENAGFVWPTPSADDIRVRNLPPIDTVHQTESGTLKYINPTGLSHIRLSQTIQYYEGKDDWHTLVANDGLKEGAIELKRDNGLSAQVRWATLKAQGNHQQNSQDNHVSLGKQVERWATLQARDYTNPSQPDDGRIQRKLEQGYTIDLNDQVKIEEAAAPARWGKPTVQDSENDAGLSQFDRNSLPLNAQIIVADDDDVDVKQKKSEGRLNPDWCELLMNFPVGWTDPEAPLPIITAESLMADHWPAPPGVPQRPHEPPRQTLRTDHRRDRIKALGNGVVPADVLPIALAIKAYLDSSTDE